MHENERYNLLQRIISTKRQSELNKKKERMRIVFLRNKLRIHVTFSYFI